MSRSKTSARFAVWLVCANAALVFATTPTPPAWPPFERLPGASDPELAMLWKEGLRLEAERRFVDSARVYEQIAARRPQDAHTYWRIARNYWDRVAQLPESDRAGRLEMIGLSEQWADRGLTVDPNCGECRLYKAGGLGARLQEEGVLPAARQAAQIGELLEQGITLVEATPDARDNPELEELYYAAAQFYRRLPDWFWLDWVIGARGDRRKSVAYMRRAAELAGDRPQYRIELGATLLCFGQEGGAAGLVAEGRAVLTPIVALDGVEHAVERAHASRLLAHPQQACGYSRDDWLRSSGSETEPQMNADERR